MRTFKESKRILMVGLIGLACIGGLGLPVDRNGRSILSAAMADPLSILGSRSPGKRDAGALTATKPARVAPPAGGGETPGGPTERVLPNIRDRPLPDGPVGILPPVEPGLGGIPGDGLIAGPPDGGNGALFPGGGGGGFIPGGGGGIIGGGGGGGGGPVPPVSPVPEPATWAMMISGVFAIGAILRRRRRMASAIGQARR